MEYHLKQQQGYLLVAAIVLIVVMSVAGVALVRMFTTQSKASTNVLQAKQALDIAVSGLEIAKRDLTKNSVSCNNLGNTHTKEALFNGQFSITGSESDTASTLVAIHSNPTRIELSNAGSFASRGLIKVGNEQIGYLSKSGNYLNDITRGKVGTTPTTHNSGDAVTQNQCLITSVGGVPTIDSQTGGKRTVSSAVLLSGIPRLEGYRPVLASAGNVELDGNSKVANSGVTLNGSEYAGSTIVASGTVNLKGSGSTEVSDGAGGLVTSSDKNNTKPDIVPSLTYSQSLFATYFNGASETEVENISKANGQFYTSYNMSAINGVTGKVIWVEGNVSLGGNDSLALGSTTNPVVFIIDGNLASTGNAHLGLYGLLFVKGYIDLTGNTTFSGIGAIAANGNVDLTGNGGKTFSWNKTVLGGAYDLLNGGGFTTSNIGLQEVFH